MVADCILLVHVAFVAFVVFGQLGIILGLACGWRWVRNFWFRGCHLAAIGFVVVQAWLGAICPLTIWEDRLRRTAGGAGYEGSLIDHWLGRILYYDAPAWLFTACYTTFGLVVLLTFVFAPPRRCPWGSALDGRVAES